MEMETVESMQKDIPQMGESLARLQAGLEEIEEAKKKAAQAAGIEEETARFQEAEKRGSANLLEGHMMEKAGKEAKESYLSLLLFTWSLLVPEAKAKDAGLVQVARIWASFHVDLSLSDIFCEEKEKTGTALETWMGDIEQAGGTEAFLLDSLLLGGEMKVDGAAYEKLCHFYVLMGCKEIQLQEAIEAVNLIRAGDRYGYMQKEHQWKYFTGKAGECYLTLVGDLNTTGESRSTDYYAVWPERKKGVTGVPKYAPSVILKIEAEEGERVEKGQTLFTLHAGKKEYCRELDDFYGGCWHLHAGELYPKEEDGVAWLYAFLYSSSWIVRDWFHENSMEGYDVLEIKAVKDGTVRWSPKVKRVPREGLCGKLNFDYENLKPGELFVSAVSLSPETIGDLPICTVARN